MVLAEPRDADTVLAVQNAFEKDFLALLKKKKIFLLMSFFSQEDKPEHPLGACPF